MQQQALIKDEGTTPRETRSEPFLARFTSSGKARASRLASATGKSLNDVILEAVAKWCDEREGRAA